MGAGQRHELRTIAGIGLSSCFLLAACAARPPERDVVRDPFPTEQGEVARTVRAILEAARTKDLDRLEAFHLYGPKFTKFDDGGPPGREDAETAKKAERAGLGGLKAFRPAVEDLKVDVFGPVAVATFFLRYEIETAREIVSGKSRSTLVFVREGGAWKIAHEHHSPFRENP